jgi:peroxiredoxin
MCSSADFPASEVLELTIECTSLHIVRQLTRVLDNAVCELVSNHFWSACEVLKNVVIAVAEDHAFAVPERICVAWRINLVIELGKSARRSCQVC